MAIALAHLLASLRSEIDRARIESADKDVRFRINSIDLELQVSVEESVEAKGGIRFWVVSMNGSAAAKSAQTHVVKLSLSAETGAETGTPQAVLTGSDVSDLLG
ncbi:trypco2 family protein [Streptomyces sp. ok210]|jgi:hypothetical protein|uniref:trypco2 family protein n=1 Tax=Streptomyces sp. ok210 TaxID=1761905 RepID=UPI0008E97CD1|nr:trypco2 family protein [Streptomyces sp. ok210]SFT21691.1 hypothetical protein SAMN04487982_110105 [Streptomyces sp. ok210]